MLASEERSALEVVHDVIAVLEGLRVVCAVGADHGLELSDAEPLAVLGVTLADRLERGLEEAERASWDAATPDQPLPYALQRLADALEAMRREFPDRGKAGERLDEACRLVDDIRRQVAGAPDAHP